MGSRRRWTLDVEAHRRLQEQMLAAGGKTRRARKRRRLTQAQLGAKCALSQSTVSDLEIGDGATLSLLVWQRIALVLDLPLKFDLGRDTLEEPADSGHLALQELVLRLGRDAGYRRTFELASRPSDPRRSTDVGLMDVRNRRLLLVECVNTFGDIGAAVRSSDRKRAEAEALAVSVGGGNAYRVFTCWVVRATRRNRQLMATYPEMFRSRFPGSSREWVRALTIASEPPQQAGLVWCDSGATHVFEWRARVSG